MNFAWLSLVLKPISNLHWPRTVTFTAKRTHVDYNYYKQLAADKNLGACNFEIFLSRTAPSPAFVNLITCLRIKIRAPLVKIISYLASLSSEIALLKTVRPIIESLKNK